jgi:hypothetical protein
VFGAKEVEGLTKRATSLIGALSLAVVTALAVAIGAAGAVGATSARSVPAIGVRLHADLVPVGSAAGSGRFDALLVRTGPGLTRVGKTLPGVSTPSQVICPPDPRMGMPCRIGGGGGAPTLPVPPVSPTGLHWMLVWRLAVSGVTGPTSATIHLGSPGAASPILSTLCTTCQTVANGHMTVTADQAQLLLKGSGSVDVQAASGQLAGHIVVVSHFAFKAPARRVGG